MTKGNGFNIGSSLAEYLKKAKNYKAYDTNGKSVLGSKLKETYEIIKTIDGDDGTFDTETLETGNLKEM